MKLLNVGCGAVRPGPPWTNLDDLYSILKPGTPERINLDRETNYVNCQLPSPMPCNSEEFDGVLISHVVEHFDCHIAAAVLTDCRRVLKPGGLLVVSVPDAAYFLEVLGQDTPENAVELFGEPICPAEPWHKSFFDYALFYEQHRQVLTSESLECLLVRAGFIQEQLFPMHYWSYFLQYGPVDVRWSVDVRAEIEKIMNRRKFSLEMVAVK